VESGDATSGLPSCCLDRLKPPRNPQLNDIYLQAVRDLKQYREHRKYQDLRAARKLCGQLLSRIGQAENPANIKALERHVGRYNALFDD
jgi:hypothetical protein